jgi:starch synthase
MYSQRYGTPPVVFHTGGLADTVVDASEENLRQNTANGFSFSDHTADEFQQALRRATETYVKQPDVWQRLVRCGMRQDWSWQRSARRYLEVYGSIAAARRADRSA